MRRPEALQLTGIHVNHSPHTRTAARGTDAASSLARSQLVPAVSTGQRQRRGDVMTQAGRQAGHHIREEAYVLTRSLLLLPTYKLRRVCTSPSQEQDSLRARLDFLSLFAGASASVVQTIHRPARRRRYAKLLPSLFIACPRGHNAPAGKRVVNGTRTSIPSALRCTGYEYHEILAGHELLPVLVAQLCRGFTCHTTSIKTTSVPSNRCHWQAGPPCIRWDHPGPSVDRLHEGSCAACKVKL